MLGTQSEEKSFGSKKNRRVRGFLMSRLDESKIRLVEEGIAELLLEAKRLREKRLRKQRGKQSEVDNNPA